MIDTKNPIWLNDHPKRFWWELTGERVKETIYLAGSYDICLHKTDAEAINKLLEMAYEMHGLLGELVMSDLNQRNYRKCFFPISKKCYKEIEKIIHNEQRPINRKDEETLRHIQIKYNDEWLLLEIAYLIETVDDQYYIYGYAFNESNPI